MKLNNKKKIKKNIKHLSKVKLEKIFKSWGQIEKNKNIKGVYIKNLKLKLKKN